MDRHRKRSTITLGVELETYSIDTRENRICRELQFPKRSAVEKGERFTRDWSIGSEFNSKVFSTLREAFFLLKSSLRKYTKFRNSNGSSKGSVIFPTGGWIDRFAGTHLHLGVGKRGIEYEDAKALAAHLHDHIPFLIALTANSPIWREKPTTHASHRLALGTKRYFKITRCDHLYKDHFREMNYNRETAKKPATLEIRVPDSSVPEYVTAALCVCCAVTLRWLNRKPGFNRSTHANYLKSRDQAVRLGSQAKLTWTHHRLRVPQYVDLFFRKYEEELRALDIPDEIIRIFKYLKKGWNQADVIRRAAAKYRRRHRPTWQIQFAKRYAVAIEELLDGNSFQKFAARLGVELPSIDRTWLGRKEAKW